MATITGAGNIQAGNATTKATIRQKSAFAVQHMMAAARFSRICGEVENANINKPLGSSFDEQIASVSAVVMLVIASLESNINEYLSDPEISIPNLPGDSNHSVIALIEKKPILEKYQFVLSFRGKEKYPTGESPFQETDALIKLRNALVHFKPEWHDEQELHKKIESRLKGRFEINPIIGENGVFFPQQCMSYGCTKWSVYTALEFMRDFSKRSGLPFRFDKFIDKINPEV